METKLILIIVSAVSVVLTGIFLFFFFNQEALPIFMQDLVGITDEKKKKELEVQRIASSSRQVIIDQARCLSVSDNKIPCNRVLQNGDVRLVLEDDGNLVLYSIVDKNTGEINILKETKTKGNGTAPYKLVMQTDGNLIIRDSKNDAIWVSGTYKLGEKNGPYTLNLSSSGRLDILNAKNEVKWEFNPPPATTATSTSTLTPIATSTSTLTVKK